MKNRLTGTEYEQVLTCIEDIHRCRKLEDFPTHVLSCLRKLIVHDLSAYNEVNLMRKRMLVIFDPPQQGLEPLLETFGRYMHEHPVISYFDQTGDGQALKISDFLSTKEYHQRDIYRNFYRHFQAEDQIAIAVRVESGFMIGIAFNRKARTFTERERLQLNLVRTHIIQAYLRVAELAGHREHRDDLQTALQQSGLGVICLHVSGAVAHATPGAFDCLSRYIPIPDVGSPRLPDNLSQWTLQEDGKSEDAAPRVFDCGTSRLTIRRVKNEDRILLLLSEEKAGSGAQSKELDQYQLTPREREVLKWMAESKSNPEIAAILGLTVGTVKLHAAHILGKLGVENRTAAALMVRAI